MAFATLFGAAVPIFDLDESIRSEDVTDTTSGRLTLDDYRRRSRASITAVRNYGIGIENIVEDTNVVFTRTIVQHLPITRVEWPEAGVVVVVMAKADGMADLDERSRNVDYWVADVGQDCKDTNELNASHASIICTTNSFSPHDTPGIAFPRASFQRSS